MKNFTRQDPYLSLCGLNCGLCPMKLGGHCGGCGFGNQSCKLARCSMERGEKVEYCFQCLAFPCEKYQGIDEYDSFITNQNRFSDLKKAATLGLEAYHQEQEEKVSILSHLLAHYNDGRRKTLYCVGVNLLPLETLRNIVTQLEADPTLEALPQKEKAAFAAKLFQNGAKECKIELKLRKKTKG